MQMATILVVDDDPDILSLVRIVLEDTGHTVVTAQSGEEAIQIAGGYPGTIDVLMTDLTLPEMSGPDLARHVNCPWQGVFMSGTQYQIFIDDGAIFPQDRFIQKPFDLDVVTKTINDILGEDE